MRRYILIAPFAVLVAGFIWAGLWRLIQLAEELIADEAVLTYEEVQHFRPPKPPPASEVLVILARPLAVIELEYPPAAQRFLAEFNHEFRSRLEVIDVLYGAYDEPEIEIESYVHSLPGPGFPRRGEFVIYLVRYGDRWIQSKYDYDRAYPTADGRWATCGPWTFEFAPDDPPLETEFIDFEPAVIFDLTQYEETYAANRFSGNDFIRTGLRARCVKGIYLSRLIDPITKAAPTLFQYE